MVNQENPPAEAKFVDLMKRVRRLGLGALNSEDGAASPAQMALIDWVALHPGCGVQEIADGLNLAPPTISVSVKKMEQNGIIARKNHPSDARSVQFFLTLQGQKLYDGNQSYQRKKVQRLLSGLTPQEQETLTALLERALLSAENRSSNG